MCEFKALWEEGCEVAWAAVDFEDFAAFRAGKMVVVGFASLFVTGDAAGHIDLDEPAQFQERIDVAVDGRHSQSGLLIVGKGEQFLR